MFIIFAVECFIQINSFAAQVEKFRKANKQKKDFKMI